MCREAWSADKISHVSTPGGRLIDAHTVLVGFGATGRVAARVLSECDGPGVLVVVDSDLSRVELAVRDGARAVHGDGGAVATLRAAHAADAARVMVAVGDDATAVRVTTAARSLNRASLITTLVRDARWRSLAAYLGADQVVVEAEMAGRLLGRAVRDGTVLARVRHILERPMDLVVEERSVRDREVGQHADECGPLVLAVVRDGVRLWRDHEQLSTLRESDRLVVLRGLPPEM